MSVVRVNVEYCTPCGFAKQFEDLSNELKTVGPNIQVVGSEGQSAFQICADFICAGSFEVSVNGKLLHSRLKLFSFPDFGDLARIVKEVSQGAAVPSKVKQQPVTDCHVS